MKIGLVFQRTQYDKVNCVWTATKIVPVEIPDGIVEPNAVGIDGGSYHLVGMVEPEGETAAKNNGIPLSPCRSQLRELIGKLLEMSELENRLVALEADEQMGELLILVAEKRAMESTKTFSEAVSEVAGELLSGKPPIEVIKCIGKEQEEGQNGRGMD